ncbi:MAG: NUDIX domain-containing protein [bacterium]
MRKIYWKIFKPVTLGARVIVDCQDAILLVQPRYSKQWYLPGGKVHKKENAINAIKRELEEECDIKPEQYRLVGIYSNFVEAKNDHIVLFVSEAPDKKTHPGLEISSCRFFSLDALPANISPGTARRLNEYKSNSFKSGVW